MHEPVLQIVAMICFGSFGIAAGAVVYMVGRRHGQRAEAKRCDERVAQIQRSYQARFLAAAAQVDVPLLRVKERRGRA